MKTVEGRSRNHPHIPVQKVVHDLRAQQVSRCLDHRFDAACGFIALRQRIEERVEHLGSHRVQKHLPTGQNDSSDFRGKGAVFPLIVAVRVNDRFGKMGNDRRKGGLASGSDRLQFTAGVGPRPPVVAVRARTPTSPGYDVVNGLQQDPTIPLSYENQFNSRQRLRRCLAR